MADSVVMISPRLFPIAIAGATSCRASAERIKLIARAAPCYFGGMFAGTSLGIALMVLR
jgi:hypothetical protein